MNNYGLINTFYPESGVICSDEKCGRAVNFMDKCFIDTLKNRIFCESCGQCIRYERKMEDSRKKIQRRD